MSALLLSTLSLGAPVGKDLLDAYQESRARCQHGDDGLIVSLHSATHPTAFRAALVALSQKELDVYHKDYLHVNAFAMKSIHPDTLDVLSKHEHTDHIEANCIIQHQLPQTVDPDGMSILFEGNYTTTAPRGGIDTRCAHTIRVSNPFLSSSHATVTISSPPDGLPICTGTAADTIIQRPAVVSMLRAHVGTITYEAAGGTEVGTYEVNANGRIQDHVTWANNGGRWTKSPGPTYDINSDIGPLEDGNVRRRSIKQPAQLIVSNG